MSDTGFNNLVQPIKDYSALLAISNAGQAGNGLYAATSMGGAVYRVSNVGITIATPGKFSTLADFTAAGGASAYGEGPVWIAGQQYWCNANKIEIISKQGISRPKWATIGNSINNRNRLGESTSGRWSSWGFNNWVYMLSQGAFRRCGSTATTWTTNPITSGANASGASEYLDAYGNYGASGARSSQILLRMPQILASYTESPDVIWLPALYENDIGNITPAASLSNTRKILDLIRYKYPQAIIILSCPGPSDNYTSVSDANTLRNLILSLAEESVYIDANDALFLNGNIANYKPEPNYFSDGAGSNVHQNERGAVVRAKQFISDFGWLLTAPLQIPLSSNSDVPGNVSGVTGGTFTANPDFSRRGTSGHTLSGIQVTDTYWMVSSSAVTKALQESSDGLGVQLNIGTNTATSGTATTNYAQCETNAAGVTSLSNVTGATFQTHAIVEIVDPSYLVGLTLLSVVSNSGSGAVSTNALVTQNTLSGNLSSVLVAGDKILVSTTPFTLGAANQLDRQDVLIYMEPVAGAVSGPKIKMLGINTVSLTA